MENLYFYLLEFAIKKKYTRLVKKIFKSSSVELTQIPDTFLSVWTILDIVECRLYSKYPLSAELISLFVAAEPQLLNQTDFVTLLTYLKLTGLLSLIGTDSRINLCNKAKSELNLNSFTHTKELQPHVINKLKSSLHQYIIYILKILSSDNQVEKFLSKPLAIRVEKYEEKIFFLTNLLYDRVVSICQLSNRFEQVISGNLPDITSNSQISLELFSLRLKQFGQQIPSELDLISMLDDNWSQSTVGIPPDLNFTQMSQNSYQSLAGVQIVLRPETSQSALISSSENSDENSFEPDSLSPNSTAKNIAKFPLIDANQSGSIS